MVSFDVSLSELVRAVLLTSRSNFLVFRTAAFLMAGLEFLEGSTIASTVVARAKTSGDQKSDWTISGAKVLMKAEMWRLRK